MNLQSSAIHHALALFHNLDAYFHLFLCSVEQFRYWRTPTTLFENLIHTCMLLCPPNRSGVGTYCLSASVYLLVCTLFPEPMGGFWPNWHRHIIGMGERNDLILSHQHWVIKCLHPRSFLSAPRSFLSALYLLNQWMDFDQISQTHYWNGGKERLDFDDLDLILKVTPALWIIKFQCQRLRSFLSALSPELIGGFWPNLHRHTTETWERND